MLDFVKSAFAPHYTFENADTIFIRGRQYRYISTHGDSHYFVPADSQGPREKYDNATIAEMLETGHFDHRPDREFSYLTELSPDMLTLLSDEEKQRASEREAIVLAAFEKYQAGDLKRTDASIRKNSDSILGAATRMLNTYDAETNSLKMPSPRTLRRWMSAYEKDGLAALYDNVSQRGNYGRKLSEEQRFFMYSKLPGYLTELKKTPANIVKDVRNAFTAENEKRKGEGRTDLLECPSRVTILAAIHHLAPFRVKLAREGVDAAMRAFSPVGEGIDVERPLQRVEMDEQKIDLISLMEDSGLLQMMTDDEKAQLGLDGKSGRWWMTVLLDVRTRCMLGMILSRTPSSKSGLRALEMAMRDKGAWASAVDAHDAWAEHGLMGTLVTDCGKQFVGHDFRRRVCDLGITLIHCPGARPWLKPYVERVFRTISSQLMPRLSGCTFGSILRKGDSDPEKKAALSVDDVCTALVRWIVDVYHNEPHEGLHGETPRDCWNRLTGQYGVTPPPSLRRRRLVFGEELSRTLQKDGLTVAGVRYHSKALATHMMHSPDREMEIRYYTEDIGAIWVRIGNQWTEVPAVQSFFRGVSYQKWRMAHRELRARHAQASELKSHVVQQALDFIERLNANAMAKVGLVLDTIDAETINLHEREAFIGFRVDDGSNDEPQESDHGEFGISLPTAGDADIEHVTPVPEMAAEKNSSVRPEPIQFPDRQPAGDEDDGEEDDFILPLRDK
ncbi:putative transposase [Mameliella alba]|uniref:Mu transposase C-terminal domain-containing protein n=1 Tax=Mameliella alba TaxID=561184 RepID=UPI00087E574F|nr:Mu transposase C-terminal domain-containing protein [Mameliella alba]OWV40362.1 hypothetical protein CDZ96_26000 [Mameliella alba]PTR33188.1 putative transposase [Mameliella alba]GGF86222.1 integrase [Mameliella alba]SDE34791.1 putative transposase [Mameliella alba]